MKMFGVAVRTVFLAVCGLTMGVAAFAQATNSGDIRGTVTDTTGALLPDVTVTVVNKATGVTKVMTTNKDGLYDTSSIVVGPYSVSFEKSGFSKFQRSSVTLEVGTSTVNAALKVGATTDQIVVNTDIPLLDTESGEQSTTLDAKAMSQLPNVGQDWQNFTILLPGTSGASNANPGQVVSANGNLPYSNILADGASTTLSHSQNSDVSVFETVAELQVSTSAFSAQYGIGGIIFNQISKGGTSQFHGTAYDYIQNDGFNAAQYGFGNSVNVPFLRYNNFGGSIGGPVATNLLNLKKKAFFFFNYDQTVNHGSGGNSTQTVPTVPTLAGDFTGQSLIYDPTTQTIGHDDLGNAYPIRKSFLSEYGVNAVPAALQDKVAVNFTSFYPTPTNHIAGSKFVTGNPNTSNGLLQNNYFASLPQSTPYRKYFGRFDYDINEHNRLTLSDTQRDTPVIYPNQVTACPVGCQNGDVDSNNAQITEVWTINQHMINEVRLGYTYQGNFFADQALNKGYAAKLGWQFAKADDLPAIQFVTNYPYAWVEPSTNAVYKEHVFDPSDVVTLIRGKHVLHFGGEVLIYQDNSTNWGNTNAGTLAFSGQYTQHWTLVPDPTTQKNVAHPDSATGLDFADFLLGTAQSWNANISPEYGARLKSPQMFIQDDYKVRPNLTLNLGFRYQIRRGWSEVHGNEATFDPTVTNPADGSKGAYWYGSTHANGRNSTQANTYNTALPRVGFSWLPYPTMTIKGGFGLYAYNLSLDTYGGGIGAAFSSSGGVSDQTNGITPVTILGGTGEGLPFTAASTDPARFNDQSAGYNQFHTPTPGIYQWNLAVQNEIGTNMVTEIAYVASHGRNLAFPVDINQIPVNKLRFGDSQADRPYPNYQSIGGSTNNAISNYNSLQASITRRLARGVGFNFNYTWSHFLDDLDSSGWGGRAGSTDYANAHDPGSNYSNSNFDVRNSFKGNLVYELPFGHGNRFLNQNWLLDELVGGWRASGTFIFASGNPFSVFGTQSTYAQSGAAFPNYSGLPSRPAGGRNIHQWYNPAAFSRPMDGTFGNVRRNSLYGPGLEEVNISAGKKFDIHEQIKMQFRVDATNAFNHPSFGQPNGTLVTGDTAVGGTYSPGAAGSQQINGTTIGGRTLQVGFRLEF